LKEAAASVEKASQIYKEKSRRAINVSKEGEQDVSKEGEQDPSKDKIVIASPPPTPSRSTIDDLLGPPLDPKNPPLPPEELAGEFKLANVQASTGNFKEALMRFDIITKQRRSTLGKWHPDSLASAACMGICLQKLNDLEKAEVVCRGVLEGYSSTLGRSSMPTLFALSHYAALLQVMGRVEEALPFAQESLERTSALLGPENTETARCRRNLKALTVAIAHKAELAKVEEQAKRSHEEMEARLKKAKVEEERQSAKVAELAENLRKMEAEQRAKQEEAEAEARRAKEEEDKRPPPGPPSTEKFCLPGGDPPSPEGSPPKREESTPPPEPEEGSPPTPPPEKN